MVGQRDLFGIVSVPLLNKHTSTSGMNTCIGTWKMYTFASFCTFPFMNMQVKLVYSSTDSKQTQTSQV